MENNKIIHIKYYIVSTVKFNFSIYIINYIEKKGQKFLTFLFYSYFLIFCSSLLLSRMTIAASLACLYGSNRPSWSKNM